MGLNATKPFGNETPQSTCCGGTGSENHTKYQEAAQLMKRGEKKVTSEKLEETVSALNRSINTMRPGNLAEMEDLRPLSELLRSIGKVDDTASASLKEAVEYGKMVMRYVADGSGTQDMIKAAIGKLQEK